MHTTRRTLLKSTAAFGLVAGLGVSSPLFAAGSENGRTSPLNSSSMITAKMSDSCPSSLKRPRTRRAESPMASPD